ncbi:MAG TPA: hypothetical protein VER96_24410 [Polyangiaceae bacterium]|nr:hypothetical protein [Polyangiaceae bacterium]
MSHASSSRLRRVEAQSELCLVVACHTFVVAIPVRFVTRLVLNEDVTKVPTSGPELVQSGGEQFVASNLGALLDLPPLNEAWVLLRVPHAFSRVPLALRTGACLVVREVRVEAPLPPGLFRARGEAMLGAFVADASRGFSGGALYGLMLDVTQLWTRAELDAAALLAARAHKQTTHG